MSFYYSESKPKEIPLRGCKKLPIRGKRARRLRLLSQFEIGHVYTFPEYWRLNLPNNCTLQEEPYDHYRHS